MTELEKNVLITKFMGYTLIPQSSRGDCWHINPDDDVLFIRGSSYDRINYGMYREWVGLINVLQKIENVLISSYSLEYEWLNTDRLTLSFDGEIIFGLNLENIYSDIVDFIIFYNNKNK